MIGRKFRADEKSLLDKIVDSVETCEENIQELQTKIGKFNVSSGSSNLVRTTILHLAYPFKESMLRKLDADIDEIVKNLWLALTVLNHGDGDAARNYIEEAKAVLDLVRTTQISSTIGACNYNDACKLKHPCARLWFVKGSQFSTWLVKPNSFLWLHGFSGCGKLVLCSTAIQYSFRHRRSNPNIGIAFFYFTFSEDSKQDASAMLRALTLQLSCQLNGNHTLLSRLYDRYRDATPPALDPEDCLHQLLQGFEHVYIILDALDESPRNKHGKNLRFGVLEV